MGFFDDLRQRLFSKSNTLWQEVIRRPAREVAHQKKWSAQGPEVLASLHKAYHYQKAGITGSWQIHVFHSRYANGFAVDFPAEMSAMDFQHLFDLLRDRVLAMDYRLANSDRRFAEKPEFVETIEKHYLKPPIQKSEPPIDQHYGNILIELIKHDEEPRHIKLMANIYNDRLYQSPRSFEEFMDRLLK